jgi:hypothetical protein
MDFLEEIGGLFVTLGTFYDDDEYDFLLLLQDLLRRRNNLATRLLQRQRVIIQRIQQGREVYFGEHIGNWYHRYPERQFKKDFRLTKDAFEVNLSRYTLTNETCFVSLIFFLDISI